MDHSLDGGAVHGTVGGDTGRGPGWGEVVHVECEVLAGYILVEPHEKQLQIII